MAYIGYQPIYDLSIRGFHSYITRSNFINSNTTSGRLSCISGSSLVLTDKGKIPIEDIPLYLNTDLNVMTQQGFKPLRAFIYKGEQEMYRVETEGGDYIECTLDHKFITNQGTKKLREIFNKDRNTIDDKIKILKYVGE